MIWLLLIAEDTVGVEVGVEVEVLGDIILGLGLDLDLVLVLTLEAILAHIPVHLLIPGHQGNASLASLFVLIQ